MADGDEAVTGLMATRVLEHGAHPIYPWGVTYGAGASVEIHLAAGLFALFGISDVALKAAGLLIWLASLALLFLAGRRLGGPGVGWAAALLFAFAPQAAQWSLKVSGGHGVALALSLLAIWLVERQSRPWLAAAVLPLAGFAHPITAPFVAALAIYLLVRTCGAGRLRVLGALVLATAAAALLLWPPGAGVWDPSARQPELTGVLKLLPALLLNLFTPNLHARALPGPLPLTVSLVWLAALAVTLWQARPRGRLLLYLLAPLAVLLTVRATELAPRHALLFYPASCLLLAHGLSGRTRFGKEILLVLLASGAIVQGVEMTSPTVHGAAPQDRGIVRDNVRQVVDELERRGIGHVYCDDPMFQWNIIWASRERIIARWFDPLDRYPDYPARVDAARLAGLPVGMVRRIDAPGEGSPSLFRAGRLVASPGLERTFPRSPRLP